MLQWLQQHSVAAVDERVAADVGNALPGVSPKNLRTAFIESGLPLAPMVEGVRQDSLENLERTLDALASEYLSAPRDKRAAIRSMVITARQHAGWMERNPKFDEVTRGAKAEILLWLRTWLENPPLFPSWAALRVKTLGLRRE